jgi:hypothetical protein
MSSKIRLKSEVQTPEEDIQFPQISGTNVTGQLPFGVAQVINDPKTGSLPEKTAAFVKQVLDDERHVPDNLLKKAVRPPQPVSFDKLPPQK